MNYKEEEGFTGDTSIYILSNQFNGDASNQDRKSLLEKAWLRALNYRAKLQQKVTGILSQSHQVTARVSAWHSVEMLCKIFRNLYKYT